MAIVALVWLDVLRTVVIPSTRGPLSHAVYRTLWRAARAAPARVRRRATQFAGPGSIAVTLLLWLGLLWLGFALVYWARIEDVSFSPDVEFGDPGLVEALYLSGTSLTTLGMGDAVGGTDALRILTVLEAGSGLGIFTATISYLPTIYTLVSELRASALAAADLRVNDPERAEQVLQHGGTGLVESLRRDLVTTREHLLRFPVLFYFRPPVDESPLALARAAAGLTLALRRADVPHATLSAGLLEVPLVRLLDELDRHVRAPGGSAELRERVDAVLGGMAAMHGYPYEPLRA